jgi:hypothetical protein
MHFSQGNTVCIAVKKLKAVSFSSSVGSLGYDNVNKCINFHKLGPQKLGLIFLYGIIIKINKDKNNFLDT